MDPVRESHFRSIMKGVTWRVIATGTTVSIAYFITGEVHQALKIGGLEVAAKIMIYYLHERAWQTVPRGTIRQIFKKKN
jgi:uncharacterized membrane protein